MNNNVETNHGKNGQFFCAMSNTKRNITPVSASEVKVKVKQDNNMSINCCSIVHGSCYYSYTSEIKQ